MIRQKIDQIIMHNKIDAIFKEGNLFYAVSEAKDLFKKRLTLLVKNQYPGSEIAIYPAGIFGKEIADMLLDENVKIKCLIDNKSTEISYHNVCIKTYDDWKETCADDAILVCTPKFSNQLYNQLRLDKFNKIIDIVHFLKSMYPNTHGRPFTDFDIKRAEGIFNYQFINKLEHGLKEQNYENETAFRTLLYGLFVIRDFFSAQKYIEIYQKKFDGSPYLKAMEEIEQCLLDTMEHIEYKDTMVLHIVDSLKDKNIDEMQFLDSVAQNGIRISGLTAQYPCTHYALNTMFTGRNVFDIDLNGEMIHHGESELLKMIEKKMQFSLATANKHLMNEFEDINDNRNNVYYHNGITRILFEGLCLLEQRPQNHFIVLHSSAEVHSSFGSVGYSKKLKDVDCNMPYEELMEQNTHAIKYVDQELKWYFRFFDRAGVKNIILGDHGLDVEGSYNYGSGFKRDMPRCSKDDISIAFIAAGAGKKHVKGKIQANEEPNILLDIYEDNIDNLQTYISDFTYIQQPPGYAHTFVDRFIPRGIYSQYEGFIGIDFDEDMYLLSASGREQYFRPNEYGYRNLINNEKYTQRIDYCKSLLEFENFPIKIYANEKYKYHLKILKDNAESEYRKIVGRLIDEGYLNQNEI
ncbi:MAG: LTA synthase family protein [Lachnospiraceae bacterium]|nr:LTA synthase family protein [Lachnospiraceae bacterium]